MKSVDHAPAVELRLVDVSHASLPNVVFDCHHMGDHVGLRDHSSLQVIARQVFTVVVGKDRR